MSSPHLDTGKKGESLAAAYLQQQGYSILHRNWRHSHYEIDIIAVKADILHFIEVKTRRTATFGYPEESVSRKKFQCLQNAAVAFQYRHPGWKRIQYNILSITLLKNKPPEYFLIEDVYL